jgi:hypothetical protein
VTEESERLLGLYQALHHRLHAASRPLKLLHQQLDKETMLGWVSSTVIFVPKLFSFMSWDSAVSKVTGCGLKRWGPVSTSSDREQGQPPFPQVLLDLFIQGLVGLLTA